MNQWHYVTVRTKRVQVARSIVHVMLQCEESPLQHLFVALVARRAADDGIIQAAETFAAACDEGVNYDRVNEFHRFTTTGISPVRRLSIRKDSHVGGTEDTPSLVINFGSPDPEILCQGLDALASQLGQDALVNYGERTESVRICDLRSQVGTGLAAVG